MTEFDDSNLGGDPLEEVGGNLMEDGPQFQAAMKGAFIKRSQQVVDMHAPVEETPEEVFVREKAIQFCKQWRDTKPELVEVNKPINGLFSLLLLIKWNITID